MIRVGGTGLRTRPLRAVLSALGIAIGIAAMTSVVGISSSSQAQLSALLDRLGTNMLTVTPGQTLFGEDASLPKQSVGMIARIDSVETVSATGTVSDTTVRRTDLIPAIETGGISVQAAELDLLETLEADLASGTWLNDATARYPAVVLGSLAAERLGIPRAGPDVQVWLGNRWFTVVGILDPVPLAPEINSSALVGSPVAQQHLGFDGHPTKIYERSSDETVDAVRDALAATANPENPEEVKVSRPSDALAAREAADQAFTGLLVGLGAVALLVGGIGVANTMVISVLERRGEIGLRRALGATKGQIRTQFLAESILLSVLGGVAGALLGAMVTTVYAQSRGWPTVIPLWVLAGSIVATVVIGAVAGLYPSARAARLSPTAALSSP
ncbi:ABC transporter permease [Nocardioides antri]|uniref:ABC transporter permease n=1 Tax=Nocardioides antri TaxID=2607659 RepID=UPI002482A312|nr:ABC transporter permease [Nocardioides antri]